MKHAIAAITALSIGVVTPSAQAAEPATVDKATSVAKAVDLMIRATRSIYTGKVVKKLKKDGKGAKQSSARLKGFVPLPAQFVTHIADKVDTIQHSEDKGRFSVGLRSLWNLNPKQGLQDSFEKEGWDFLVKQQESWSGDLKDMPWKPYIRTETVNGKETLRYFSADVGSVGPCVSCHNAWEKRASVKKSRKAAGVEPGKKFALNELMGAVVVNVALD